MAVPLRSYIDDLEKSLDSAEELNAKNLDLYRDIVRDFATDAQIYCSGIILPGHKYVLSSRCEFLAKIFSSGVDELDWNAYEQDIGIALLRWFYTDTVAPDNETVTLGLLRASFDFELPSLFVVCERNLLISMEKKNCSVEFLEVAKAVNAEMLIEKCIECGSTLEDGSLQFEQQLEKVKEDNAFNLSSITEFDLNSIDPGSRDEVRALMIRKEKLDENCTKLRQSLIGVREYMDFFDTTIWGKPAHTHVLFGRSEKFRTELSNAWSGLMKSNESALLRWLYTDAISLDNIDVALAMLAAAHKFDLHSLFDRCEQAVVEMLSITSCAQVHHIAKSVNATKALEHCERIRTLYWNDIKSELHGVFTADADHTKDMTMTIGELPPGKARAADATLSTLNDDCLLHLFRFISLTDLGSIKDTCRRFHRLADQSFKLYGNKSLEIRRQSMIADIWNLKHFGKFIESLSLEGLYNEYCSWSDALQMIGKYSNEKLESIRLCLSYDESVTKDGLKCLRNVVKNVRKIEMNYFPNGQLIEYLLSLCENLSEIQIDCDELELKTLWCSKNLNIKSVTLRELLNDDVLVEICEVLPHLESFAFIIPEINDKLHHLSRLNHLKQLKIDCFDESLIPIISQLLRTLAEKNVLEYLSLSCGDVPDAMALAICNFPKLKRLEFEYAAFGGNTVNIFSEKLNNVEMLSFYDCEEITFGDITKIILNQLNLNVLTISGCENIESIDRQNYLRLRKRRKLEIFLEKDVYDNTIKLLANELSDYVKISSSD